MLASKLAQGTSSTERDITHSGDEDAVAAGLRGAARRKRRKERQRKGRALNPPGLRLLWKHKCYPQAEVCCSWLARLESKGIQMRGHQHDPHNYT